MTRRTCPPLKSGFSVSPILDNSLTFCNDYLYFLYESNTISSLFANNSRNQETTAVIGIMVSPFDRQSYW